MSALLELVWDTTIVYSQNSPRDNDRAKTVFIAVFNIRVFFLCYGLSIVFTASSKFTQCFNHFLSKFIDCSHCPLPYSMHPNARLVMWYSLVCLLRLPNSFLNRRFIMRIAQAKDVPSLQGGHDRK